MRRRHAASQPTTSPKTTKTPTWTTSLYSNANEIVDAEGPCDNDDCARRRRPVPNSDGDRDEEERYLDVFEPDALGGEREAEGDRDRERASPYGRSARTLIPAAPRG